MGRVVREVPRLVRDEADANADAGSGLVRKGGGAGRGDVVGNEGWTG